MAAGRLAIATTLLIVAGAAPSALAHGGDASESELLMDAPLIQMPIAQTPPAIDGRISSGEWPAYAEHALDAHDAPGAAVFLAHDEENVYAALRYEGGGWGAVAWAEPGEGPAQVVSSWLQEGVPTTTDAFAEKLDVELENQPDAQRNRTSHVVSSARATASGTTVVEIAFPMETDDENDVALEPGGIHAFVVAWNQTDPARPVTLDEGAQVWLRVFVDRPQDAAAEIHHLFAVAPSAWPNAIPLVLVGIAAAGLTWSSLRRPRS